MRDSSPPDHEPTTLTRPDSRNLPPQRIYRFRILGMGLVGVPLALVLHEHDAPLASWAWIAFTCLLWPHLAWWVARRGKSPYHSEVRNLLADSIIAGSWIPLIHFTVLPAVLVAIVVTADKMNSGVRGLWLRSLPGMAAAILAGSLLTGFAFQPATSMPVLLACLPIMLVHTMAVSLASYRLVRKVQRQNRQLNALTRIDALTGLHNRSHWQDKASALLQQRHADGRPATLMMLDIDHFKDINDQHGHPFGDDVLCAIAEILRDHSGAQARIGRFGGDEFAIALPVALAEARTVAENIRQAVENLRLPSTPNLHCSISIGLAEAADTDTHLRQWIESADRTMYRAKQTGRNRTAGAEEVVAGGTG